MKKALLITLLLGFPAVGLLFRFGIHTRHDPHVFRQIEFQSCVKEGVFPCRWSPDAGMGFGEPLFNFYGQGSYVIGSLFVGLGWQIIDAVKIVFILSILISGISMYIFSSNIWGKRGGIVSAVIYMYAPYRAVDVWVRGALPECVAFILFPIILHEIYQVIKTKKVSHAYKLGISLALLIITHNLSVVMLAPFALLWAGFWLIKYKTFKPSIHFIVSACLALGLAAFYILPVVVEGGSVMVEETTKGYYDYHNHFVSINQLFISNFWGYGGSTWGPNDGLSFSIGQVQIVLLVYVVSIMTLTRLRKNANKSSLYLVGFCACLTFGALLLTHNKSVPLWEIVPIMKYIQFPWRFLSIALVFLSFAIGSLAHMGKDMFVKISCVVCVIVCISVSISHFAPGGWQYITDNDIFIGKLWDEGRASSLTDFWPKTAPVPKEFADNSANIPSKSGEITLVNKLAHTQRYNINLQEDETVTFPVVFFPGWRAKSSVADYIITPDKNGLVSVTLPQGNYQLILSFSNTPIRTTGNIISILSGVTILAVVCRKRFLSLFS